MSITSQRDAIEQAFSMRDDVEVVDVFEESKSAKSPGRDVFNRMLERIERGDAIGILAWAPDRLARNSVDGGRIIYLLDRGVLRDLKFCTYTYENNSQGKFMLSIMFGQSKYYSDALSENVKRGNRTKIANGWRPNLAPIGYLNDKATKTIVADPIHFPLIRRMFELMLTASYSPRQIAQLARDEWGFTTPKRRKIGGVPLALSSTYKILSNPFYAGLIEWGGQLYAGKHPACITLKEFQRVRAMLARPGATRPKTYVFPFTGLMRCGGCGLQITAEHKTNRFGSRYVYYHCTRRGADTRCREPSIEARALEAQIEVFLATLAIGEHVEALVFEALGNRADQLEAERTAARRSLEAALQDARSQMSELTGLRIRGLIEDDEFLARRRALVETEILVTAKLDVASLSGDRFEPLHVAFSLSRQAATWFRDGDDVEKRLIVESTCSNLMLKDKIISIEATKPFTQMARGGDCTSLLATVEDVRTPKAKKALLHYAESIEESFKSEGESGRHAKLNHLLERIAGRPEKAELKRKDRVEISRSLQARLSTGNPWPELGPGSLAHRRRVGRSHGSARANRP